MKNIQFFGFEIRYNIAGRNRRILPHSATGMWHENEKNLIFFIKENILLWLHFILMSLDHPGMKFYHGNYNT